MGTNLYVKFSEPAIAGGSSEPGHAGDIDVLSWSHAFDQTSSPTRGTVEQANHANFTFSKYADSASADLLKACWSGRQFGKAVFSCYRAAGGGAPVLYLEVAMEHVVIANFSIGAGSGDMPIETIALDYGIVTYRYKEQHPNAGTLSVSHDLIEQIVS